jgi:hypothetical protein
MAKIQTSTDITFLCPVPRGNPHTQYQYLCKEKNDIFVKSEKFTRNVIPAKAGIQKYQGVKKALDTGLRRCDRILDFSPPPSRGRELDDFGNQ